MASRMGLLGKKIGMMQSFDDKGIWHAYTVVEVGPCVVLDIKTIERDGYTAIKLGFDEQKPHRMSRPEAGVFAKAQTTPKRLVREIRLSPEEVAQFSVGDAITVDQVFRGGEQVDLTGVSKGKGFQGVMKRHHFSGFRATHGTHEYFRHGGSIGCRLTPGRVIKGRKMAGQMGNKRVTVQNLRVAEVLPDKNVVLLSGSVPGAPGSYLTIKLATKRAFPPFELLPTGGSETGAPEPRGGGDEEPAAAEQA